MAIGYDFDIEDKVECSNTLKMTNENKLTELQVACFQAMRKVETESRWTKYAQQSLKRAKDNYKRAVEAYETHLEANK
jgi:hypothetical protein